MKNFTGEQRLKRRGPGRRRKKCRVGGEERGGRRAHEEKVAKAGLVKKV